MSSLRLCPTLRLCVFPLLPAVISVAALLLRWPIASHDVEHYIGPDEGEVVANVLEMIRREDLDHRHPGYPGLHFYLQRLSISALLLTDGRSLAEIEGSVIYLRARRMTLVAGAATAAVVYAVGLEVMSVSGAVLAAALIALSPLAFRESAVVNPDLMLGLFVALALLAALRLRESSTRAERERPAFAQLRRVCRSPKGGGGSESRSESRGGGAPRHWEESPGPLRFLAAGAAVGLATAVKYTGAFTIVPYALASLPALRSNRGRAFALAGLAAALGVFALSSPYTFVNLFESARGLERHFGYYRASSMNAALEVLRSLGTRGLGIAGSLLALFGAAAALRSRESKGLIVLGFPAAYLLVFAFFDRAYPRHALALLPAGAILAAFGVERVGGRARWALALALLAGPALGSFELRTRAGRPSPADRALAWTLSSIPEGSRILQDQWTPRLDPSRYRVHRLRVEEQVFAGNFDWVFYSGYPPGIEVSRLQEVQRFATDDALGAAISVHRVPERAALMGTTLGPGAASAEIGAGELPYFGEGFDPPRPGAYGTERLSRGDASEIFFVLSESGEPSDLEVELSLSAAAAAVEVGVEVNGLPAGALTIEGLEPAARSMTIGAELLRNGLNRLVLRYRETVRLSRRHREAAVRFYRMRLTRS